jgi:hypothetical protein
VATHGAILGRAFEQRTWTLSPLRSANEAVARSPAAVARQAQIGNRIARGLDPQRPRLFVIDGSKGARGGRPHADPAPHVKVGNTERPLKRCTAWCGARCIRPAGRADKAEKLIQHPVRSLPQQRSA